MIVRKLKLKLSLLQEKRLQNWLHNLTGVYNWSIRKIELDARDRIYHSEFEMKGFLSGHSKKLDIPSHTLHGICLQGYYAWQRYFQKISRKPRFKSNRNKLNSIPFPDPIEFPINNGIKIPYIGMIRFYKQNLPNCKIKGGRIIKKSSGWYLCLWMDTDHRFEVKQVNESIGIDPGFSTLLSLSNGIKIENPRELRNSAKRLSQSQRGNNKHLTARLYERRVNRCRDRNHKISHDLIRDYKTIYYSNDNFQNLAKTHGKSVSEAGLGQLISMIKYKAVNAVREVVPVNSAYTTMTCSTCNSRSGPTGMNQLAVRHWECCVCGTHHDRDINAAKVVLNVGAGCALKESSNGVN